MNPAWLASDVMRLAYIINTTPDVMNDYRRIEWVCIDGLRWPGHYITAIASLRPRSRVSSPLPQTGLVLIVVRLCPRVFRVGRTK